MIKEESDYHDLESVVQQVEQNLELMTVRGGARTAWGAHCQVLGVSLCGGPELCPGWPQRPSVSRGTASVRRSVTVAVWGGGGLLMGAGW